MLFGRYASNAREARYPQLWLGRQWAVCPSVQGPSGLNLYDLAGGRRHGTLTNMDAPTDWVRSQGRYALDFDGTNDYVGGFRNIQVERGLTISLWFKAANTSKTYHSLYSGSPDATPDLYVHLERVSGTTYRQNYYLTGYLGAGTSFTLDDAWHHYAFCHSADGTTVRYYRDGQTNGTATVTPGTISQDNSTASIGAVPGLAGSGFAAQGQMDDVARYGRELSGGEIRLLAMRRGIAYEMRRDIFGEAGFKAYLARQRAGLIGGGVR